MINLKFSVITAVLNGQPYVKECLDSVLNQDYTYIEHIFMDAGSTDGSKELITEYQNKYPGRIKLVHSIDHGTSEGIANGWLLSDGDVVSLLGSDDLLSPNAISSVADFLNTHPDTHAVFGNCNYIDTQGRYLRTSITKDFDIKKTINDKCSIPATSIFFRRIVIDTIDPKMMERRNSETEFFVLVGSKFRISRIDKVLSDFRVFDTKRWGNDYFYNFAKTNYLAGRNNGAGMFSPCARRYYLATLTVPVRGIVNPIFNYMSTGATGNHGFLVKLIKPFQPLIRKTYKILTGSE